MQRNRQTIYKNKRRRGKQSEKSGRGHSEKRICGAHRPFRFRARAHLAFDTIYAEGQRRYMEKPSPPMRASSWARWRSPMWRAFEGLPPAISIDQKSTNRNPRSTVGTVTEIYDYFRLLYARIGIPHCPKCRPGRSAGRRWIRWWTGSWSCRRGHASSSWLRWCGGGRAAMRRCWSRPDAAAMSVCG